MGQLDVGGVEGVRSSSECANTRTLICSNLVADGVQRLGLVTYAETATVVSALRDPITPEEARTKVLETGYAGAIS